MRETWSLELRDERKLKEFENRVLRKRFWPKQDDFTRVSGGDCMLSFMFCAPQQALFECSHQKE